MEDTPLEIDHIVLAARGRIDAERELDRAGLGVAGGRTIPGLGLSNLIVPLNSIQFLEIHYPNGEPPSPGAPPLLEFDQQAFAEHPSVPLIPMAWLVQINKAARLQELAAANGEAVIEVESEGPGLPSYSLVGFGANFTRRWLPALIYWPEGVPPLNAAHQRHPTGIVQIEVAGPRDEIHKWCGGIPRGLRTVTGTTGPQRVDIGFADGSTYAFGLPET